MGAKRESVSLGCCVKNDCVHCPLSFITGCVNELEPEQRNQQELQQAVQSLTQQVQTPRELLWQMAGSRLAISTDSSQLRRYTIASFVF